MNKGVRVGAERSKHIGTVVVAACICSMAAYMVRIAGKLPKGLGSNPVGPRTFPLYVLSAIVGGAFLLVVMSYVQLLREIVDPGDPPGTARERAGGLASFWIVCTVTVALGVFVATWHTVGFLPASTLFVAALSYFLDERKGRPLKRVALAVLWAVAFASIIWVVFVVLLNVPLPVGKLMER